MEISNFEADVLETQVKWGKMHMIFVISISKLTETARSGEEVRKPCSCSLLVSIDANSSFHVSSPRELTHKSIYMALRNLGLDTDT